MANNHPAAELRPRRLTCAMVALIFGVLAVVLYILLTFKDYVEVDDSFESTPVVRWYYDGNLPVTLVPTATHGAQAARLGERGPLATKIQSEQARLYRTMYITPTWERPVLSFWYRVFANDIIDYSDFVVYVLSSEGNSGAEIKRDGFRTCRFDEDGNALGTSREVDLGWRTWSYDLSAFKGQTITLVFENRNLYGGNATGENSLGICTYVDDVRVVDAGPWPTPPCPPCTHFPIIMKDHANCDPTPTQIAVEALHVAPTVGPTRPPTPEPSPTPEP